MSQTAVRTRNMIVTAMFVALIAAGAFLKIPVPVVPFTLQYLFTMLAGMLLGARRGCLAVCIYILLGLIGLPVFANGGGISYVLQPSFGYIIGFAVGAYVTGLIAHGNTAPSVRRLLAANFSGLAIVYLFGIVYYDMICRFYLNSPIGFWTLFLYCFLLCVPGDIVICIAAAFLGNRLIPLLRKEQL